MRRRLSAIGGLIVLVFVLAALAAPLLAPYDPAGMDLPVALEPPSAKHLLGTDELGRDVLSRILFGARTSLVVGVLVVLLAGLGGTLIGLVSGYFGGFTDTVLMRAADVVLAFPSILFALLVVAIIGPGLANIILSIGFLSIPDFARVVRSTVLASKEQEYITACRVLGVHDRRIMLVHVLPNSFGPAVVHSTFLVGSAILIAGSLSFLGLGIQPPDAEWGGMLSTGRRYMTIAPHLTIAPGLALLTVVLAFNFLGDGLRDALDPHSRSMAAVT